jgi:hypothetical protein
VLVVAAGILPVLIAVVLAVAGSESDASVKAARGAVRLFSPSGRALPGRWQSYADAALVPTVAGRVTVRLRRCPARPTAAGCVYTSRPRTVFLRPGGRDPRGVLLHELGHVFDLTVMNNRDRGRFRHIMRRTRRAKWWRGSPPLAEQFAEAYSWCARYSRIVSIARYSSYRYRPTSAQHRRICALIRRAATDRRRAKAPADVPVVTGPHPEPPPPPSTAPGVVPGDPNRDPGPQHGGGPKPTPTPTPGPGGSRPGPIPTGQPSATPTIPPLPLVGG